MRDSRGADVAMQPRAPTRLAQTHASAYVARRLSDAWVKWAKWAGA